MKENGIGRTSLVEVPEPEEDDIWKRSFIGMVTSIKDETAIVLDQEENAFDIEIKRLTLVY